MIVPTSLAVSALLDGAVPQMKGKNLGSASQATLPITCGTNAEAGGAEMIAPAILTVVAGADGFVTFEKGRRIPSTRMVSPRISAGASKPRMPAAAISSSNG